MISIPIYQPTLNGREKEYVIDCLDSGWISSKGKYIQKFEELFAEKVKVQHATTVSNGTVALHLAMLALGIGPGDEVIVPTFTYVASVNAVAYTGATPVFVDSIFESWQISSKEIRKKITSKTRAIVAVHLYGHPCEMDALMAIAREHGLYVIEDCAEALGSLYKGVPVGGIGHVSTFSFFGNKTITTGEGGMVASNDQAIIERVIHFKRQGVCAYKEYWHDVIGYNYRMTNICAAIGLAQLEQADEFINKKCEIAKWYRQSLAHLPIEVHGQFGDVKHSYWMVSILVEKPSQRDALREHLARNGIETRPLFYPVHTMPMYSKNSGHYPVAQDLGGRGINLPSWPGLHHENIKFIVNIISDFFMQTEESVSAEDNLVEARG